MADEHKKHPRKPTSRRHPTKLGSIPVRAQEVDRFRDSLSGVPEDHIPPTFSSSDSPSDPVLRNGAEPHPDQQASPPSPLIRSTSNAGLSNSGDSHPGPVPHSASGPPSHTINVARRDTETDQEPPFTHTPPPRALPTFLSSSRHWFWRAGLLIAAWLHLFYHLSHDGCALLLKVLRIIFIALGQLDHDEHVPQTLRTGFRRLGLDVEFQIHAVCPTCRRIYPPEYQWTSHVCTVCDVSLFSEMVVNDADGSPRGPGNEPTLRPLLQCPQASLISSVIQFLWEGLGENERDADWWRRNESPPGVKRGMPDGKMWKELPGVDGQPFFDNRPNRPNRDELRLGITLGFDGFGYQRSSYSATHSSGVVSISFVGLPNHKRYRTHTLKLYGLTPGPTEFTADELQYFLENLVNELIQLYEEGIFIETPLYRDGRRVRVVLVAVCCDHPAMCKVSGFADHRKETGFCPRCHIPHKELNSQRAMSEKAYEPRVGKEHTQHARAYKDQPDEETRAEYFQEHNARYFELSRLPYFDPVRMSILDPMHNILLGVVKTQWYDAWIKTNTLRKHTSTLKVPRELDQIHQYLKAFEMPRWVARLPTQVGYPAGGSLGADEWKCLILAYCPIVIPLIWDEWYPAALKDTVKKRETWAKNERARKARLASGKNIRPNDHTPAPEPLPRMLEDDADNFLKLASALKILLAHSIRDSDVPRAKDLLFGYLSGFQKLHPDNVKPNHHYLTHIFEQIEDYGPVYGFWSFIFERLNKVLKSYRTSGHGGGEIEVTFMREFMRNAAIRNMLRELNHELSRQANPLPEDLATAQTLRLLLASDSDARGTVASLGSLAHTQNEELVDVNQAQLTTGLYEQRPLTLSEHEDLLTYYSKTHRQARVVSHRTVAEPPTRQPAHQPNYLTSYGCFYTHVILNGRRIVPSTSLARASDSIIQTVIGTSCYVGQVFKIIGHSQPGVNEGKESVLLDVRWFRPLPSDPMSRLWEAYPELEVRFWEHGRFLNESRGEFNLGPPTLVPVESILSQACRLTLHRFKNVTLLDVEDDSQVDVVFDTASDNGLDEQEPVEYLSSADDALQDGIRVWATIGLTKDTIVL